MRTTAVLSLTPALVALGCATVRTTTPGVVGVDRPQRMIVSSAEVNVAAAQQYATIVAQARARGALDANPELARRVRSIAARLIARTGAFRVDAPQWQWEAHVISSKEMNAWCMPGGKIAVYSGFVDRLQLTDDELAAVMGHEIAHALREHGRERISEQIATGVLLSVAATALKLDERQAWLAQVLTEVVFTLPNSRVHEQEADRMGVELAARAGFDPRGAVTLWQKMERSAGGGTPEFLSTHPSHESRVRDLTSYSRLVMPLYSRSHQLAQVPTGDVSRHVAQPISGVAYLTVGSNPLAPVFVNGKKVPANPMVDYVVPAGLVRLLFERADTSGTWTREMTITLAPGEHRNLGRLSLAYRPRHALPDSAYVTVGSIPLARIFVNGESIQSNPVINYAVPAGEVHLRFVVTDSRGTWMQLVTVTLSPGERRNLGRIALVRQ